MKKYITFLVLSLLLFPRVIEAADCSHETVSNYSKILGNINYTYRYREENKKAKFDIILLNVPTDFYVRDEVTDKYYMSDGKEMVFSSYEPNATYRFEVFPDINACSDIGARYIYVTVPGYNPYYNDPVCDGVTNYQYCNRWFQNNLSYKDFVAEVTAYKERRKTEEVISDKKVNRDTMNYILDFLKRYYMIILPIIIVSTIGYIIYHNRRDDSLISVK